MSKEISVVSSFATDRLVNNEGLIIAENKGGPAFFIQNALKKEEVPFKVIVGSEIEVEILLTEDGEFGRIPHIPDARMIDLSVLSDWTVVSTIVQEWNLSSLRYYSGKLMVDMQGYVRNGRNFGRKKRWNIDREILEKIMCIKGTREEIGYILPELFIDQCKRMVLITDGAEGLEMIVDGKTYNYSVPEKVTSPNTLGAGDTLLGSFTAMLYKGLPPEEAILGAMHRVSDFLKSK